MPFIIPHFGAGLFREALMAADTCANVYLDTSSSNGWIGYTPGLTLENVFRTALSVTSGNDPVLQSTSSHSDFGDANGNCDAATHLSPTSP